MSKSQITSVRVSSKPTPMMEQFLDVKSHYQEFLLFYRMGDFYEMFFHDAEVASELLGIALTKRGQMNGNDIPMCGVPVHAMDGYLEKLIRFGRRVAVCEQAETPENFKKRGGKGPLPRAVVRVVTAGTLNEDGLLAPTQNNYLAAIGHANGEFAVAWSDMSTGSFQVQAVEFESILTTIERLNPAEILFPETQTAIVDCLKGLLYAFPLPKDSFESSNSEKNIKKFFGDFAHQTDFSRAQFSAINGILNYLSQTQISEKPFLLPPVLIDKKRILEIDPATRRSLEITKTLSGEKKGCLLDAIDKTKTAIGARLLANRIASPLAVKPEIEERFELVSWFLSQNIIKTEIGELLKGLPDFERSLTRLSVGRGGPRDLFSLATAIEKVKQISGLIEKAVSLSSPKLLADISRVISNPYALSIKIKDALAENLPLLAREGQFIRAGFDTQLDSLRDLRDESRGHIASLQREYSASTGISSLKVKHNNVVGYHIEVRSNHAKKLMSEEHFIHRQTTAQAVRFTTTELGELESKLATAANRAIAIEVSLFDSLVEQTLKCQRSIANCASIIAQIDVAISTALLAEQHHYVRPNITNDTRFLVESGRHPVVEILSGKDTTFIENDCNLTQGQKIWLVTGPNMAGKSTFLRQNAHFVILAQAGLFVPAKKAEIGIVDKLFSRVGASDDLARGQSTFMVEMVETAIILNQATPNSLVILDEIGRGTSTYDGLAIAHATLEHLHNVNMCRGLFATHYHELTILKDTLADVQSYHMLIKEWNQQVIFLHQVVKGRAGRSYGIHVAELAGLPELVTERAKNILLELESQGWKESQSDADNSINLPLFSQKIMPTVKETNVQYEELMATLKALQPDNLTPKEALNVLYELHRLYKEGHE